MPVALMPYVSVAWRFLNSAGYINFGVAPELAHSDHEQSKGRIIVVGAGLAGELIVGLAAKGPCKYKGSQAGEHICT